MVHWLELYGVSICPHTHTHTRTRHTLHPSMNHILALTRALVHIHYEPHAHTHARTHTRVHTRLCIRFDWCRCCALCVHWLKLYGVRIYTLACACKRLRGDAYRFSRIHERCTFVVDPSVEATTTYGYPCWQHRSNPMNIYGCVSSRQDQEEETIYTNPSTSIRIHPHSSTSIHIHSHPFTSIHIHPHPSTSIHIHSHPSTSIHRFLTSV